MKPIYYNTEDRWGDYWREVGEDKSELDTKSYPISPAINYLKKNDGIILEAGCGLGRLVKWLTMHEFDTVGMKLDEYSIFKLKRDSSSLKCIRGDACQLPFKDNTFKYIFLMGVIDVFIDSEKREWALGEARRVLQKGGIAFISVPHGRSLFWSLYALRRNSILRKIFGRQPLSQYVGQFAFTKKEICSLVKKYFKDFDIYYVNFRMAIFYILPFLRSGKLWRKKFQDLQKKERMLGEKVYEFNKLGKIIFPVMFTVLRKIISPTLYIVSKKA